MNTVFPLGFPGPTAFYLVLYVVTLALHVLFMNYVLAGTAIVAASALASAIRRKAGGGGPIVALLREWLPFALSAAITAGIAPLLFMQILYKRGFYTANLLLFHRWMLILPALVAGFYLLYALKTQWVAARPRARALVGLGALFCFAFTALSWTENALLSMTPSVWADLYASGKMTYRDQELGPRLLLWSVGAFPTLSVVLGWQVAERARRPGEDPARWEAVWRALSLLALGGLALSGACVAAYASTIGPAGRSAAMSPAGAPYVVAAAVGAAIQGAAWAAQRLGGGRRRGVWLTAASFGLGLTVVGTSVAREVLRIAAVDFASLYADHARAAEVGGRWVFFAFFALNAALAAWAIRTVLRKATEDKRST